MKSMEFSQVQFEVVSEPDPQIFEGLVPRLVWCAATFMQVCKKNQRFCLSSLDPRPIWHSEGCGNQTSACLELLAWITCNPTIGNIVASLLIPMARLSPTKSLGTRLETLRHRPFMQQNFHSGLGHLATPLGWIYCIVLYGPSSWMLLKK